MTHPYRARPFGQTSHDSQTLDSYGEAAAHPGEEVPRHQDLLTQTWQSLVNGLSSWAHQPPGWFPAWMSDWLLGSSFPTFWMWCFSLVGLVVGLILLVVSIKVCAVLCGGVWSLRSARNAKLRKMMQSPYQSRRILTANETEFYGRLRKALMPRYAILSQVSMSALLEPKPQFGGRQYMQLRAKFSQKFVDFVICVPETLEVIALVELDDITHDVEKDALRDEMTEGAGYVTVRWHSRNKPAVHDIARTIDHIADERAWMSTQPMEL